MKVLYASNQKNTTSCDSYIYSTTNLKDFIVHCGGILGGHPCLINKILKDAGVDPPYAANEQQVKTTKEGAKKAYTAITFLSG